MGRPSVTTEASVVAYLVNATLEEYDRILRLVIVLRSRLNLTLQTNGDSPKRHRRTKAEMEAQPNNPRITDRSAQTNSIPSNPAGMHVTEPPEAWDDKDDIPGEKARAIAAGKARKLHTKTDADGNAIGVA